MESKAILYHSNETDKCELFLSHEGYLIQSENRKDDIWLGKGMYFWDNKGNVIYWNQQQISKNSQKKYSIVVVNALLSNLLDLTDYEIYIKVEELWNKICESAGLNKNIPLGNKLNYMFDVFEFEKRYDLIKVYGKYNRTPSKGVFKFDYSSYKTEPTMAVKCIYNIKNSKCILEKESVKEG